MYNKVQLIGRLGQDPEAKALPSGKSVVNLSIATSEFHKGDDGQRQERTTWHNCVAFDKTAEVIELYTRKGSLVFVEGSLRTREWDDKNNGQKRKAVEIVIREVKLLDPKPVDGRVPAQAPAAQPGSFDSFDDDIPF
jgi:single-strand DNA-binding protein